LEGARSRVKKKGENSEPRRRHRRRGDAEYSCEPTTTRPHGSGWRLRAGRFLAHCPAPARSFFLRRRKEEGSGGGCGVYIRGRFASPSHRLVVVLVLDPSLPWITSLRLLQSARHRPASTAAGCCRRRRRLTTRWGSRSRHVPAVAC
jgi:hypothetical protein